jgi:hypothetical protein
MTLAITPTNASNGLEIEVLANAASSVGPQVMIMALYQDSTANALAVIAHDMSGANDRVTLSLRHTMAAGTTSETTFKVRIGGTQAGTTTFNGSSGSRLFGGVYASSVVIREHLA